MRRVGWGLFVLTALLTLGGALLYAAGFAGWAQFLLVLASGTAGGCIAVVVERRFEREKNLPPEHWKNQPP